MPLSTHLTPSLQKMSIFTTASSCFSSCFRRGMTRFLPFARLEGLGAAGLTRHPLALAEQLAKFQQVGVFLDGALPHFQPCRKFFQPGAYTARPFRCLPCTRHEVPMLF